MADTHENHQNILQKIIINARPGAGKSELIKFLSQLDPERRKHDFHIGKMHVIDDFPYLWRWFEEEDILQKMGKPRIFTDKEGYFKHTYLWDLLIHLINLEYEKFSRDCKNADEYTVFVEFSRGTQHGGYKRAYPLLSDAVLENASIIYMNVSWEETLRKNHQRFNPEKPDSILEHGIPDKKLEYMYSGCDFVEFAKDDSGFIMINQHQIPFCVFENEDDVTSEPNPLLASRLRDCCNKLWLNRD